MSTSYSFDLTTPGEVRAALGAWVRQVRQRENLTQAMLAQKAGVPASTLSLFERDGSGGVDTLLRLLQALGQLQAFHDAVDGLAKKAATPRSWDELELRDEAAPPKRRVRVKKAKSTPEAP